LLTKIACAETHCARGEARNSTVPTISSIDASRPETCAFLTYSTDCGVSSPWKNGVSTAPGATVFAVTPRAPSFLASARVNCSIGPLWLHADAIARGELVHVLPRGSPPASAVHALVVPGRHRPAKIRVALELLRARVPRLPGVD